MVKLEQIDQNTVRAVKNDSLFAHEKAIHCEIEEAASRNIEDDSELFQQICDHIEEKLHLFHKLKTDRSESDKLMPIRQEICMLILDLKKLHRLDKFRHKMIRDRVLDERQKVDQKHLQFQNLMYESNYLQKEIAKCLEFKSKMDDLDLVSQDEVLNQATDEQQKQELIDDRHQCVRARLKLEYNERKRLIHELQEKEKVKSTLSDEIDEMKKRLEDLKPLVLDIQKSIQNAVPSFDRLFC